MKKLFIFLLPAMVAACTKSPSGTGAETAGGAITNRLPVTVNATNNFKGLNWADPADNFKDGLVVVSGLASTDTYASVKQKQTLFLRRSKTGAPIPCGCRQIHQPDPNLTGILIPGLLTWR